MPADAGTPAPPARDNRWKLVESTMRRHGHRAHALIEVLHSAQEIYGFLDPPVLAQLAREMRVPLSRVYGVATFYNFFTLRPPGPSFVRRLHGHGVLHQGRRRDHV